MNASANIPCTFIQFSSSELFQILPDMADIVFLGN